MAKRLFDVCFAGTLLILCSPALLLIAVLVSLTSRGRVLFTQERVGLHGKGFTIYKFRTMYTQAPKDLYAVTSLNDPFVTPFGRFLRRHHFDELPQLWNVLKGDMSVVGPRPTTPALAALREQEVPNYAQRYRVRPGLTGLTQIKGRLWGGVRKHQRVHRLNMFYIKKQSLCFDLHIVLATAHNVVHGTGI